MEYKFTVKRNRISVTQGSATVYLNGIELVTFGDTIEIVQKGQQYYGDLITNWASTIPDGDFVYAVLFHSLDKTYHYSDKAKAILKGVYTARSPKKAQPGRMFIDVDAKIAAARSKEEQDAWEQNRKALEETDFCDGWHVGIYKHACGHWEVLQAPIYKAREDGSHYTAEDADKELRIESTKIDCSRCCICGGSKHTADGCGSKED